MVGTLPRTYWLLVNNADIIVAHLDSLLDVIYNIPDCRLIREETEEIYKYYFTLPKIYVNDKIHLISSSKDVPLQTAIGRKEIYRILNAIDYKVYRVLA